MDALSPAEQAEALALFYAKKARDLKKAARLAAAPAPVPVPVDPAVLGPAPAGVDVEELAAEAALPPLAAAIGEAEVPPYVLAPAPAGVELVFEAEIVPEKAPKAAAHRQITQKTLLSLAEDHAEIAARVLSGEISVPLWGTSRYVPKWRTQNHSPDSPICLKIREILTAIGPMIKYELTERLEEALGIDRKEADSQIRELSKMGILLF
jgi:hypothetical protein